MASDEGVFAAYHSARILDQLHKHGANHKARRASFGSVDCASPPAHHPRYITRMEKIANAWADLAHRRETKEPTAEEMDYRSLLQRSFAEYGRKFAEERDLIGSGAFTARIVTAMKKMRHAEKLLEIHVNDMLLELSQYPRPEVSFDEQASNEVKLFEAMTTSKIYHFPEVELYMELNVEEVCYLDFETPWMSLLLAALDTSQVKLTSLKIALSDKVDFPRLLKTTAENRRKMASTLRQLTSFDFRIDESNWPREPRDQPELIAVRDLLEPVLNSENIGNLSIDLRLWTSYGVLDPFSSPFPGVAIQTRAAQPNLTRLALHSLPIHFTDLEHLLTSFSSNHRCVTLKQLHLLDGSWSQALEILKDRHRLALLAAPSGAECEGMASQEYERVFGEYHSYYDPDRQESKAELYIRGYRDCNPMQVHEPEPDPEPDPFLPPLAPNTIL